MQGAKNMKTKIIILTFFLFILCGCTAQVNIDIKDMQINESISIEAYPDNNYTKDQLLESFRTYIPIDYNVPIVDTMPDEKEKGITYYNRTYKDLGNGYRFNYNYNFNISNYPKARSLNGAFKSSTVQVNKGDKEILISTDNSNIKYFSEYPSLSKITINITPSYKVKESNADSINNNVHTWTFEKNTKKNIYLLLSTEEKIDNNENEKDRAEQKKTDSSKKKEESAFEKFVNEHPFLVAIGSILLFIILVAIISKITRR